MAEQDAGKLYVWVKGLESKLNTLRREVDILKENLLKRMSQLAKESKAGATDILELRREQELMQQKMDLIIKELKQTAGREEVQVLKKYIEYWNPLTFVTQHDLERFFETKRGALRRKSKKHKKPRKIARKVKNDV